MSKTKELIRNTFIIFLGKIATQLLTFFLLPIYTSYLETADYGNIDLIITYIQLLIPVVILELDMGVFRFLIDARSNNETKNKIISSTVFLITFLTSIFSIIFALITIILNIKFGFIILLDVIVTVYSSYLLQVSRGLGKNMIYSIACFLTSIVTIVFNIIFIMVLKIEAISILYSSIIGNIVCSLYLIIILRIPQNVSISQIDKSQNKEILKYSIPLIPNFLSWWIVNVSDRTIITTFINTAANGIYATATKFPNIINSLFSIFSLSWNESASLHINDDDKDEFFSSVANNVMIIFTSISTGIISLMPFIFSIFIKDGYNTAYYQIPILTLGSFFNCFVLIYSAIYVGKKMTKQVAITSIYAAIINILINISFIKIIGLYAASISTVISYFSMAVYRHFDSKKFVNIRYKTKNVLFCIACFLITFISYYVNNTIVNILTLLFIAIFSLIFNYNNILIIRKKIIKKYNNKLQ